MSTAVSTDPHRSTTRPADSRRGLALVLLAVAQMMLVLDVTVVNVALPDIGASLHLGRAQLPWVMTSYTLLFGGLMLLGGRLADAFGPRTLTLLGLAVFTGSSLLCGVAGGAGTLLAGRSLQGVGAAMLSPAALATVTRLFTGEHRGRALGLWSALGGVGSALGVIIGGVLTSEASWRWIFTVNVPVGAVLLVAIPLLVPAVPRPADRAPGVDVPGALLVTATTGAAIYGLVNAGGHGWTAPSTLLPFALAAVAGTAFVAVERHARQPLLEVALLRRRSVLAGSFLMLVVTGLMVGGFFVGSFALQHLHHYSALRVGTGFLPVAVATVLGAHTGSHLLTRVSARPLAIGALALVAAGYALAALWSRPLALVGGLSIAALGIGACFVTAFTASLSGTHPGEAGLRSALVNTFHELGGAAGVAVLSTVAGAALVAAQPASHDFARTFTVGAVAALGALVVAALIVPDVRRAARDAPPAH